jgi:hypothetical protein
MGKYIESDHVRVHPFSRQAEGAEVVIGRIETGSFLALPPDAVEVLDDLAAGKTVGEAQGLYFQRHGETPDLDDFLGLLETKGFVQRADTAPAVVRADVLKPAPAGQRRPHFDWIPQSVARHLFSPAVVCSGCVFIAMALVAVLFEPRIFPGRDSLYFVKHQALSALSLFLLSYTAVFIHEMGHLLAARAVGVNSRMAISHRLWVLVAETDLTGLWGIPKRDRYVPLLAGPFMDAVSMAVLLFVLFATEHAWIPIPGDAVRFIKALTFLYLMRLLWQCFFFVRTDFYYVLASIFNCRNLLRDTEAYLRNQVARLGLARPIDQRQIPPAEMRIVRAYAPIWLAGRVLALGLLFLVTLPVLFKYLRGIVLTVGSGYSGHPYAFVDSIAMSLFTVVPLCAGLALWVRSLAREWRGHRGTAPRSA